MHGATVKKKKSIYLSSGVQFLKHDYKLNSDCLTLHSALHTHTHTHTHYTHTHHTHTHTHHTNTHTHTPIRTG